MARVEGRARMPVWVILALATLTLVASLSYTSLSSRKSNER